MTASPASTLTIGIIGGGVAGMSCALWLTHLGFKPVIIEQKAKLGGQLLNLHRINRWVLGSVGQTSAELAEAYAKHIHQEAISIIYESRLLSVTTTTTGFCCVFETAGNQHELQLRALIIATGVSVLGAEAFAPLTGFQACSDAGLITCYPTDHIDKLTDLAGKTVAVIGGGANAHFTAKDTALAGAKTYLLIRSHPKARPALRKEVEDLITQGRIIEFTKTQTARFHQDQNRITVTLQNGEILTVDRVFVRLGFAANSEFLDAFPALGLMDKEAGYIKTDVAKRTSIPWVYAIGDVANAEHQSVVNAIAEGAIAAQDLSERI